MWLWLLTLRIVWLSRWGCVEYLHRSSASRRRQWNGKSRIWDSKITFRILLRSCMLPRKRVYRAVAQKRLWRGPKKCVSAWAAFIWLSLLSSVQLWLTQNGNSVTLPQKTGDFWRIWTAVKLILKNCFQEWVPFTYPAMLLMGHYATLVFQSYSCYCRCAMLERWIPSHLIS
jgi:hypothetical protein